MPSPRPFTDDEDALLKRLYAKEYYSLTMMSEALGRSPSNIEKRIKELGLVRSMVAFRKRWSERRNTSRAASSHEAVTAIPNQDERHWRRCLAEGGFEARVRLLDGTVRRITPETAA